MYKMVVKNEIRQFIVSNFLFGQADNLADDDSFLENAVIDSTGIMELVAFLEEKYEITIEDEELVPTNLDSVARVVVFVERKVDAKSRRIAG